jgi:hypothetical protein
MFFLVGVNHGYTLLGEKCMAGLLKPDRFSKVQSVCLFYDAELEASS